MRVYRAAPMRILYVLAPGSILPLFGHFPLSFATFDTPYRSPFSLAYVCRTVFGRRNAL